MIQTLREKMSGITAMVIIALIGIPFAFYGVESIFLNSDRITDVAKVDGEAVSSLELERQISLREGYLIEQMGENFDPAVLDRENLGSQVLEYLIDQKILEISAREGGLGLSDAALSETILAMPQFQLGGAFSESTFRAALARTGFTTASFMDALEGDLIVQTLQQGILGTGFSTREEIAQAVAVASETRDFQYFVVPAELYLETVEIDEEQVALFYEENREQFRLPEQVSVNYLLVDRERISQNIEVSEAQIQEAYRLESAASLPQREAAHILIAPREDGSDAAVVAEVQQKLEAGSDFSELAAEYSDDLGSANFGGELGYTDGSLFPEAFESALAALEVGEVSAPVTTDSGTHFIKLAGFDAGSATPLEEMRGVLESNIREAMADQSYQILLDQVRDSAFATDDLQQLLDDLRDDHGLVIEQSGYFSREAGEGIAANDLFRSLAFSPLVLEERLNSELIELTDTTAAVVHLRDRQPARDATLSEVSAEITRVLALQQAAAMTKERGEELLQRASGEESLEQIAQSEGLDWQVVIGSPRDFADPAKINAFSVNESEPLQGFSTSSGDYMILKLDEISPGSLSGLQPEEQQAVMRELSFVEGNLALNSYLQLMRSSRDIEIR